MNTISWFVQLALEVVAVLIGLELFFCIIRPKTRKKLLGAIGEITVTVYNWIRQKLSKEEEPEKELEEKEPTYEIHLTLKEIEEFNEVMKSKRQLNL